MIQSTEDRPQGLFLADVELCLQICLKGNKRHGLTNDCSCPSLASLGFEGRQRCHAGRGKCGGSTFSQPPRIPRCPRSRFVVRSHRHSLDMTCCRLPATSFRCNCHTLTSAQRKKQALWLEISRCKLVNYDDTSSETGEQCFGVVQSFELFVN